MVVGVEGKMVEGVEGGAGVRGKVDILSSLSFFQ